MKGSLCMGGWGRGLVYDMFYEGSAPVLLAGPSETCLSVRDHCEPAHVPQQLHRAFILVNSSSRQKTRLCQVMNLHFKVIMLINSNKVISKAQKTAADLILLTHIGQQPSGKTKRQKGFLEVPALPCNYSQPQPFLSASNWNKSQLSSWGSLTEPTRWTNLYHQEDLCTSWSSLLQNNKIKQQTDYEPHLSSGF